KVRNHVFGICGDTMLVQIQTVKLTLARDAQRSRGIDGVHHRERNPKRRGCNSQASDSLRRQKLCAAAIKQSLERGGIVRGNWTCRPVFSAGKQAEGKRSPDAADSVDWDGA